jgi:GT2 family glycosyltransferase/tetratricopeptide (TPR) repeat protein
MKTSRRRRALLIQLEFPTWETARPWTYSANFAIQEGLEANGVECVTAPAIAHTSCSSPDSWVYHAKKFLAGERFDQVWLWLVHTTLDVATMEWVAGLAPIRVGILMESLQYEDKDYAWAPQLKARRGQLDAQLPYLTHILAPDEQDGTELSVRGPAKALWWPPMVPERFIATPSTGPSKPQAVFHGTPYGRRQDFVKHVALQSRLTFAQAAHPPTRYQSLFDRLQQTSAHVLREGRSISVVEMANYVQSLQKVRLGEFSEWMAQLPRWPAIVNLPSLAKFYGGRVFESMAVGRPVISWNIPDRPRNLDLFQDGHDILLFNPDDPNGLACQIDRVLRDRSFADSVVRNAQDKLKRFHTAERRLHQTLEWIEAGAIPDYGFTGSDFSQQLARMVPEAGITPTAGALSTVSPGTHAGVMPLSSTVASIAKPGAHSPSHTSSGSSKVSDSFYVDLFVNKPGWSTPEPNTDEAARWSKIASFLEYILHEIRRQDPVRTLRILDIGCGRGWLTNLASSYGTCEGVEPVAGVVEYARRLFPALRFEVGTPESVLAKPDFTPFDIVLCSEVIEHVPHPHKAEFVTQLSHLLAKGGYLVLTTPRGEMWEEWSRIAPPNQPVEDWVTEQQLGELFETNGFHKLGIERIHVEVPVLRYIPAPTPADLRTLPLMPIYQVWACRRANSVERAASTTFTLKPMVSVIVPTYQRPKRLRVALESLAQQSFQDYEVIIVNDAGSSVDHIVAEMNHTGRLTLINHDRNRGLAASRNTGLRQAKGKYVCYLDDDDRYLPDHLETLVSFLEHNEYKVAYTDAWRVHERLENDHPVETGRDLPYSFEFHPGSLLISNYIPVLCVMHERSCLDDVGGFDEALFAHEDWDLWIRMATKFPFQHLKRTTGEFTWRTDGSSMTSGTRETYWRTMEIIYRKYQPHAERIPGVREAQRQALNKMRASIPPRVFDCSIIIPVCNKVELTQQCMQALADVTTGPTFEVIIVDNGSDDGTPGFLQSLRGDVRIIRNADNRGFAEACNQGARSAGGRYLVFLNNDTIPTSGWLNALVDELERHPEVAVVGSRLLYEDGTIQHAGVAFSRMVTLPYHIYRRTPADSPMVNRRREFQCVTAACMMVRREVFESVSGFDEGYRNGFEDVDMCLKIGEQGWRIVYQPKSVVYHLESQTPGRKTHEQENARRLLLRWGHKWWLGDEDAIYVSDGYANRSVTDQKLLIGRLVRLDDPEERRCWTIVADAQLAAQRQEVSVLKDLLAVVQEWPADEEILRWGAWVCRKIDAPNLADGFWRRMLTLKEDQEARIALARFALDQGQVDHADSHVNILLSCNAQHGEGWFLRGIIAMQRQAFDEANLAFQKAFDHGGDPRKSLMGQGMAAAGLGQLEQAWNAFSKVLDRQPDDGDAIHWLLRAGIVLERWEALAEYLKRFASRNPGDLSVRFALAGVFLRLNSWADARHEYDSIHLLNPAFDGLRELASAIDEKESPTHDHATR